MMFLLFFLALNLFAGQIELYYDCLPDAKEQEIFLAPSDTPLENLSLTTRLGRELEKRGWTIRSWNREAYKPWFMSWPLVKSWQDLKWLMGFGVPKKDPIEGCWVFWGLGPKVRGWDFSKLPKEKMVLFLWEPPTVQKEGYDPKIQACFSKIYTWDDDLVDGVKFFKFYYPVYREKIEKIPSFEEKKFCTMINSRLSSKHPNQLYSEREKTIRFFEDKTEEFDLYGKWWEKRKFKNWRGIVPDKLEALKNYRYCICYENTRDIKGYVTEKIFDCFATGVVPVYWGAGNIEEYVPPECFIDRRKFKDNEEMYRFLKSISKEEHEKYLKCAEAFLQSGKAKRFTQEQYMKVFLEAIGG